MLSGLFSGFMVGTWLQASVMAVVAGTVGFFVVLRGSSFEAHAIPQGAFTGAALVLECSMTKISGYFCAAVFVICVSNTSCARPM